MTRRVADLFVTLALVVYPWTRSADIPDWVGAIREAHADLYPPHTQDRPHHLTGLQGRTVMRQRGAEALVTEEP